MRWQKNSSVNCRHIKIKRAERNKWLLQRTTTEDRTGPDTQAQDTGTLWTGPGSNVTVRGNIWSEWKLETWRDSVTMSRTQTLSHRHDDRVNELTSHERRRHQSWSSHRSLAASQQTTKTLWILPVNNKVLIRDVLSADCSSDQIVDPLFLLQSLNNMFCCDDVTNNSCHSQKTKTLLIFCMNSENK